MQLPVSSNYLIKAICGVGILLSADLATETRPVIAQITSDGSFSTLVNQSVTDSCIAAICEITGGRLNDANSILFHSFEQFSLSGAAGAQSALFVDPGVGDIIVRVTGDSDSFINGTLAASHGSTANLFFINPQGISFGPEARLDLGGGFTASTASKILFDNDIRLSANSATPATAALLKVSQPLGLGFLAGANGNAASAPITVSSTGNFLSFGSRDLPESQFVNRQFRQPQAPLPPDFPLFSALSVQPNAAIRLIGNGVTLSGGNLIAEGGLIEIGSVQTGDVIFAEAAAATLHDGIAESTLTGSLNYDQVSAFSDITLSNSASLDVSAPNPGKIFLASRNLFVSERSAILAETLANANSPLTSPFTGGGLIDIQATDLIQLSDVPPGTPGFRFFSYLSVDAAPHTTNPGGLINLQAQNLTVTQGAQIGANTFGGGKAGTLQLTVDDTISLIGLGELGLSAIFSSAQSPGNGDAGHIDIDAGKLLLQNGGRISTVSETTGATGGIDIKAGRVQVEGTTPLIETTLPDGSTASFLERSAIESDNRGLALEAGEGITIAADQVLVTAGGRITASTAGPGDAGSVDITADEITVAGRPAIAEPGNNGGPSVISSAVVAPTASGNGSTVTLNSRLLSVLDGGQVSTGTVGSGNAGDLIVNSDSVLISGRTAGGRSGLFSTALFSTGNGGNLTVTADQLQVVGGGTVSVSNFPSSSDSPIPPGQGAAGNLTIDAQQMILRDDAILNADTATGDRGNITLTTDALILRTGSRITTNARAQATGGNITINAEDGFVIALPNENSDITANAEFGAGGQVNIIAQDVLGIEARPELTSQSDITASSEFGAAGETRLQTLATEIREEVPILPESTDIPTVAQGCSPGDGGRFVQTGRGGTGTTPYGILNSRNSLSDVSLPNALAPRSASASEVVVPLSTSNPSLTEAQNWATNAKGEVVLFAANTHEPENARCLNWQS